MFATNEFGEMTKAAESILIDSRLRTAIKNGSITRKPRDLNVAITFGARDPLENDNNREEYADLRGHDSSSAI